MSAPTFSVVRWYAGGIEGRRSLHDVFSSPRLAEDAARRWSDDARSWVPADALQHGVELPHRAHDATAISRREAMRRFTVRAEQGDTTAAMALAGLNKLDEWKLEAERRRSSSWQKDGAA
jgi:hypothetical protein